MVKNIKVGGKASGKEFSGSRWREAILYFLFGIWEGRKYIYDNPVISFDDVNLRWCWENMEYYNHRYMAYGTITEPTKAPHFPHEQTIRVEWLQAGNVRDGLVQFVKNYRIKAITIGLEAAAEGNPHLILSKGGRRRDLHVSGTIISDNTACGVLAIRHSKIGKAKPADPYQIPGHGPDGWEDDQGLTQ